ncbi:hypothetical protein Taro_013136, partial [Colocasia esculenta]|nr:hypothetical protein [Colocasia esculenta]
ISPAVNQTQENAHRFREVMWVPIHRVMQTGFSAISPKNRAFLQFSLKIGRERERGGRGPSEPTPSEPTHGGSQCKWGEPMGQAPSEPPPNGGALPHRNPPRWEALMEIPIRTHLLRWVGPTQAWMAESGWVAGSDPTDPDPSRNSFWGFRFRWGNQAVRSDWAWLLAGQIRLALQRSVMDQVSQFELSSTPVMAGTKLEYLAQ